MPERPQARLSPAPSRDFPRRVAPEFRKSMRPRYRIAHVLPWTSVGGTEHATLRIAASVGREGFESVAFCPRGDSPVRELFDAGGVATASFDPVEPSYRRPLAFLRASFALAHEFRRAHADLVHCSDLLAGFYAAVAGKIAGLPVLCHIRCRYEHLSQRDRSFLRAVDRFAFVSRDAWQHFAYRVPEWRGVVVYDGVEAPPAAAAESARREMRAEFGIPAEAKVVGMVARIAPAKDYPTLVRAAGLVVAAEPGTRFLVVGDHSQVELNREHYHEVRKMLTASGLSDHFIFTGHRDDVSRLIEAMDVFVLSTHTEGLPLVILEAMARGKPVVATAVGGVPEVVADGETGLLHRHGDDRQLAEHLLALLRDEARAAALGRAGLRRVREKFTPERFAADMAELYSRMLRRGGRAAGERGLSPSYN